jgi:hypothetical protein
MAGDPFAQRLRLIGRITRLFKKRGWDLIVVGGSAVEFYTEGQYLSGDIDICRRAGQKPIPPAIERDIMLAVSGTSTGTRRQWKVGDVFVDFLGEIETAPGTNCRTLETPEGPIQLMPAEDVLVERLFVAQSQDPPQKASLMVARKMAAAALTMGADFDWPKAYAIARSRDYGVEQPLREMVAELSGSPKVKRRTGKKR